MFPRILGLLIVASLSAFGQTKIIEFNQFETNADGTPRVSPSDTLPMTRPTSFAFDTREILEKVSLRAASDGGLLISVPSGEKQSGLADLKWQFTRAMWNGLPIRIRYWMIPRNSKKMGGELRMKFHAKPGAGEDKKVGASLGTYFSRKGLIEFYGLDAPGKPYLANEKYEFDWLVNFSERTASLQLNGVVWIKDLPLPESWLTDRPFAYLAVGQSSGGDTHAEWEFGGFTVEEIPMP